MASTAENIMAMNFYSEVELENGGLSMDQIKIASESLEWLDVESSTPHLCLRHWLVQKANNMATCRDVIVWESLYYIVKDIKITDQASVLVADIYDQSCKLIMFRK